MKARTAKAGSYHHGTLRDALLVQALAALRKHGAQNLSLRDLARAIGVSQAAPYRHFPDKDSLLAQLAAQGYRELAQAMRAALKQPSTAGASGLQAAGVSYVQFAVSHPEQYRLMFGSYRIDKPRHAELLMAASDAYSVLLEAIRKGVNSGELRNEPVEALTTAAWSIVHGLASLIIDERLDPKAKPNVTAIAEHVTQLLIDGIASRKRGGGSVATPAEKTKRTRR